MPLPAALSFSWGPTASGEACLGVPRPRAQLHRQDRAGQMSTDGQGQGLCPTSITELHTVQLWPRKPALPKAPGPPAPQYPACAGSLPPPLLSGPVPASALPPGAHSSWAPSSARSRDASVEGFFVQTLPAPEPPPSVRQAMATLELARATQQKGPEGRKKGHSPRRPGEQGQCRKGCARHLPERLPSGESQGPRESARLLLTWQTKGNWPLPIW